MRKLDIAVAATALRPTAATAIILYMRYGRMRITIEELATELGIKEGSLRNLISDNKCAVATYTEGRNRYADVRTVGEYLDQRYREATQATAS